MPNITNFMYSEQLREIVLPSSQNIVWGCNQITLHIVYYTGSMLVRLLKIIDVPVQVSDIYDFTFSFKFIKFSFQIFLLLVPEMSTSFTFYIVRLSMLLWFGSCNHCILGCFLWSTKHQHFSSNLGLCCLNSYRPGFSLAGVLMFSLTFRVHASKM
jgi:hypothetical protein